MSTAHNRGEKEHFAKVVLMPGDPMRAKYIAENYLENATLVTDVRGMYGYTGGVYAAFDRGTGNRADAKDHKMRIFSGISGAAKRKER